MSPEESKHSYIKELGQDLGKVYYALWQEVAHLHVLWREYNILFYEKDTVDLLNSVSGSFFAMTQRLLINEIFLSISRITDPLKTAGKENLTVRRFPLLLQKDKADLVKEDIERLDEMLSGWKNIRHKKFAHKCLEASIGNLEIERIDVKKFQDILDQLALVMNRPREDTHVDFTVRSVAGGAKSLILKLEKVEKNDRPTPPMSEM